MALMINQKYAEVEADVNAGVISLEECKQHIQLRTLLTVGATAEYVKPVHVTTDDSGSHDMITIEFEVKFEYFEPLRGIVTSTTTDLLNRMLAGSHEETQGVVRYLIGYSQA